MVLTDVKNITVKEYSEQKVLKDNIMWCSSVFSNGLGFQMVYDWPAYKLPNTIVHVQLLMYLFLKQH